MTSQFVMAATTESTFEAGFATRVAESQRRVFQITLLVHIKNKLSRDQQAKLEDLRGKR